MTMSLVTRGVLGGSGGAAAPSIASISPTSGSALSSKQAAITVTITNDGSAGFSLCVKFVGESRAFVIWDSERGFYHPFTDSTYVSNVFTLYQNPGWQDNIEDLFISGVA